jgi:thioredoxin reductase (NADPH)
MVREVVILGSGPAGLTAAIYAARAGLRPLLVEGMQSGGQLSQTTDIENFPGFEQPLSGPALMEAMRGQAVRCGVELLMDEVQGVDFSSDVKRLETMMNGTLEARAVVVCSGAAARWTGLPGESRYRGRGVSACATCDGAFFRGMDVAVIGGGDTAMGDALYLSRICRTVTVVHRRDSFRASKVMADRVLEAPNVQVAWNSAVDAFLGDGRRLSALRLRDVDTGALREIPVSGAFVAIGHEPATRFLVGQVELDAAGYVVVDRQRTSVNGVFAAGDCADPFYKQAVVAAGAGAMAALEAERYLAEV